MNMLLQMINLLKKVKVTPIDPKIKFKDDTIFIRSLERFVNNIDYIDDSKTNEKTTR